MNISKQGSWWDHFNRAVHFTQLPSSMPRPRKDTWTWINWPLTSKTTLLSALQRQGSSVGNSKRRIHQGLDLTESCHITGRTCTSLAGRLRFKSMRRKEKGKCFLQNKEWQRAEFYKSVLERAHRIWLWFAFLWFAWTQRSKCKDWTPERALKRLEPSWRSSALPLQN